MRSISGSLGMVAMLLAAVGCSNGSEAGNSGSAGKSGAAGAAGGSSVSGGAGNSGGSKGGGAGGSSSVVGGAAGGSSTAPGGAGAGGKSATTSSGGRTGGAATGGGAGTDTVAGGAGAGGTSNASTTRTGGTGGGTTGPGGATGGSAGGQTGSTTPVTCSGPAPTGTTFTVDAGGVNFTVGTGKMYVQVCADDIIRVQYTSSATLPKKTSLSVSNPWDKPPTFCVTEASGTVTVTTGRLKVKVAESTGIVSYTDLADKAIVAETSKSTTAATVESTSTFKISTAFTATADEGIFGLGQRQDNNMNMKGKSTRLQNANTNINIPVMVSSKGYGFFWDNPSVGNFSSTSTATTYSSEAGDAVDYYFLYGPSIDQVIAGYRTATGAAPLFPKWAYGFFQSKDHYGSQSEITKVMDGYRNGKIPVDVIVQDWDYWDPYTWGSHIMDPSRYADPKALLTSMHTNNIHGMISVWPEYQYTASPKVADDQDNYKALDAIKALLPNNGSAYHFYDTFSAEARTLVYQQTYDKLLGKYGWDGIWADNTEPQDYPSGAIPNLRGATTAAGKGALVINAYPLEHARALYEGWRKVGPNTKRVYVLTRSAWAGTHRFGASVWSGDIDSAFATYAKQIPAGLNIALAGMPYWTTDIGGYFGTPTDESFTRWFQFGAFCSIFRVHGQATKELYGSQWNATTKAATLAFDTLHYRLMPYLYSLAWKTTNEGYTIMRHLVFDYQNDSKVFDIKDQFMYGPALMINPVTAAGVTSRSVYLPAGTWYDFWTGATETGGASVTAPAPISSIPIYVKAGSILPMGPKIQYANESADPLEIRIYKGADGSFTLYDDAGDTYDYETGKYATITLTWDDAAGKLTVGARKGSYTGMLASRTFNVVLVGANKGTGVDVTATADQTIKYDGSETSVTLK
jgi:alpha-D-xyloside xylohydrolase